MPIPVQYIPSPAFDRSLVPYVVTNFSRTRDALLKAFGGEFQTGVEPFVFAAVAGVNKIINFPVVFNQTSGPIMIITPIDNPTFPGMHAYVTRATVSYFIAQLDSTAGAVTGTATVRWVAWYP